jgi:hypothetical protein
MSEKFSVVLTGKLADGFELPRVKSNIAQVFKLAPEKVEKLFRGKPVALKRGVDKAQAMKLRNALARAGALGLIKADVVNPQVTVETPAVEARAVKPEASPAIVQADISCPRCGHEQPRANSCSLCKMDLSLHLLRIKRREQMIANRHQLKNQAGS